MKSHDKGRLYKIMESALEVKERVQAGWSGWRRIAGVICEGRVCEWKGKSIRLVRPAMLYGMGTVPLTEGQEAEVEVAELKTLRFSLGVTRWSKVRNKHIGGTAHEDQSGAKLETRLGWSGHERRSNEEYVGRSQEEERKPAATGVSHSR